MEAAIDTRCLEVFPAWLRALADDARALLKLLEVSEELTLGQAAARALVYLTQSLDLIADGLEELGYLDDAFVLRFAAAAVPESERALDPSGLMTRLAEEAELLAAFLGPDDTERFRQFVAGLGALTARGRSVAQVLEEPEVRDALARDVRAWAETYPVPTFTRDAKTLVKVRAFLRTKLP